MTQQTEKAIHFKSMHVKSDPLVLYNIWDAGGAKALAGAGAKASATGSYSVAAAHGFADGETMPLEFVLPIVERIAGSTDIPLSVDFEGGYALEPEQITANVIKVIKAGAIGINFEDRVVRGQGLHSISTQVKRIEAVREAANQTSIPIFINARTDLFLAADKSEHETLISQATERQTAYAEAGADGFFIPGVTQISLIEKIVAVSNLPVNAMMKEELGSISDVIDAGVSRISFGPGPYINALSDLVDRYKRIAKD